MVEKKRRKMKNKILMLTILFLLGATFSFAQLRVYGTIRTAEVRIMNDSVIVWYEGTPVTILTAQWQGPPDTIMSFEFNWLSWPDRIDMYYLVNFTYSMENTIMPVDSNTWYGMPAPFITSTDVMFSYQTPGVDESKVLPNAVSKMTLLPNPAKNEVKISLPTRISDGFSLKIYAANGKLVNVFNHNESNNSTIRWDCQDRLGNKVANGIYLVELMASGKRYQGKLIVRN